MHNIPTPESVTPEWLTEQLRRNGINSKVKSFDQQRIGTGQIGMCFRYQLSYEGAPSTGAPSSLIGKFPSDDPASRATGVQLKNFLKEVSFYQELNSRLSINTPRCYYSEIHGEGPDFMLLLEDLSPGEQGDQLKGCNAKIAEAAILQLVGLHGPSWCDHSLTSLEWLGAPDPESATMVKGLYQGVLPGFLERFGHALDEDQQNIIAAYGTSSFPPPALTEPFSLIHIDYRLDNLLINQTTEPNKVTAVDWQSITLGNPMTDVGYFIGAGMLPEERRPVEMDLVKAYHTALTDFGVSDYEFDDCWQDYRKATFAGFPVTVVASMLVQQTERGDEMFTVMADRHSRHALDLGAGEFL